MNKQEQAIFINRLALIKRFPNGIHPKKAERINPQLLILCNLIDDYHSILAGSVVNYFKGE